MDNNKANVGLNLREIAVQLLKEISSQVKETDEVTHKDEPPKLNDDLLSALHVVFPQTLLHALDLVDREYVTKITAPSGRQLYQVKGSSGKMYNCLMSSEFCTCPSYTYYVLLKEEVLMCKHVLAIHIAEGLSRLNKRQVSDEDLAKILMEISNSDDT